MSEQKRDKIDIFVGVLLLSALLVIPYVAISLDSPDSWVRESLSGLKWWLYNSAIAYPIVVFVALYYASQSERGSLVGILLFVLAAGNTFLSLWSDYMSLCWSLISISSLIILIVCIWDETRKYIEVFKTHHGKYMLSTYKIKKNGLYYTPDETSEKINKLLLSIKAHNESELKGYTENSALREFCGVLSDGKYPFHLNAKKVQEQLLEIFNLSEKDFYDLVDAIALIKTKAK